jgi:catechol 2,3-dioxygenase-like lactoylglutathione lyase family enzyme
MPIKGVVAVMQSNQSTVPNASDGEGRRALGLSHASVVAKDLVQSVAFYTEILGMAKLPTPDFGFPVQWLLLGDRQFHVFQRDAPPSAANHIGILVADFVALYHYAKARKILDDRAFGCSVRELPGGALQMYLRDPAGNLIEINAAPGTELDDHIRTDLVTLENQIPQGPEGLRSNLFSTDLL